MGAPTQGNVVLMVEPLSCLHDEPVTIQVSGLLPNQHVTLMTHMKDSRGVNYISYAHFIASEQGVVDVSKMESQGGQYKGNFPMGLIGSLRAASNEYKYTRFFKRDVENPNEVRVSVHEGHLSDEELCPPDPTPELASVTHLRHYMGPGVQRIPVRYGKVRGTLFLPKGPGPFPGVVDMFGTAGGLLEYRSAQLASRGFASLALAFFAYDDLPKHLEEFNIAYFEEAVEFLLKHEKILKPSVGAIGTSKGADLALSMATYIPEVKAAVWINGCNANVASDLHLPDGILPGLGFDISRGQIVEGGILDTYEALLNPDDFPETIIPIENADANFLFLVGLADRNWKSEVHADMAIKRLQQAGHNNYEVHKHEQTGHLLEPPHSPHCAASYHKMIQLNMMWGGKLKPHQDAQVHSWETVLRFLNKNIDLHKGAVSHPPADNPDVWDSDVKHITPSVHTSKVHKYEGAGHVIEPPQSPYGWAVYHRMTSAVTVMAGLKVQHLQTQVRPWTTGLQFLRRWIR